MAGFSVVNNLGAVNALNRLNATQVGLGRTLGRLSSGLRINSAADDASGLAIADSLRADVAALNQAVRNANDGSNIVQVADGALAEISNLLQRAVALSEQAASDTSGADSSSEKGALNSEFQSIVREINRISDTVDFNGRVLFGSAGTTVDIQIGISGTVANDVITVSTASLDALGLGLSVTGTGQAVTTTALNTKAGAQAEFAKIKTAIDAISTRRGSLGSSLNRIQAASSVISTQAQNLLGAEATIRDADVASEIVNLTKFQVLQQTGLAALAQANTASQSVLSLLR